MFKILAFYKLLGKPNTVFTSVLTLISLKGNRREKYIDIFTVIGISFSVKISQNARLFRMIRIFAKALVHHFQLPEKDTSSSKYLMHL